MKKGISQSILAIATATLASAAFAQNPAPPPQDPGAAPPQQDPGAAPPQPAPAPAPQEDLPEVSESQLDTFTTIYVGLQELNSEYQEEFAEVETEEAAVEVQSRLQAASTELIEEHDWSLDRYNQIARAINEQPEVLEQALELINEKS